jgi:hypothetical protein
LGYGARVGILPGAMLVPSLSLSIMRRHLPQVRYGDIFEGELADFATNLQATNVRVTAGISFPFVDLAAGFGFDRYTADALIRYIDIGGPEDINLELTNTRQVVFLDAGLSMGPARVVGELGYQTGKDQRITTNFTGFDPTAGHVYWSAGLRFTF